MFYQAFKLCDKVRIDYDGDGGRLVERFMNYPRRPCLQRWSGVEIDRMPNQDWEQLSLQEPDRLVRRLWHDWLLVIGNLYTDLKETIGPSPLAEREPRTKLRSAQSLRLITQIRTTFGGH